MDHIPFPSTWRPAEQFTTTATSCSNAMEPVGLFTQFFQKNVARSFEFGHYEPCMPMSNTSHQPSAAMEVTGNNSWELDQFSNGDLRELESFDLDGLLTSSAAANCTNYVTSKMQSKMEVDPPGQLRTSSDIPSAHNMPPPSHSGSQNDQQLYFPEVNKALRLIRPDQMFSSTYCLPRNVPNPPATGNKLNLAQKEGNCAVPKKNKHPEQSNNSPGAPSARAHQGEHGRRCSCDETAEKCQRRAKHFWQYNIQAKGPKRQLPLPSSSRRSSNASDINGIDPHVLHKPIDPVFNNEVIKEVDWKGIKVKHTGKARRGDGNDLTPNVKKLWNIGRELDSINAAIEQLGGDEAGGTEVGMKKSARKEKNKLASRGCRLKKKAQHEANKIKLKGLEDQHRELLETIKVIRNAVSNRASAVLSGMPTVPSDESMVHVIQRIRTQKLRTFVSGRSAEYVDDELKSIEERQNNHMQQLPIRHRA